METNLEKPPAIGLLLTLSLCARDSSGCLNGRDVKFQVARQ